MIKLNDLVFTNTEHYDYSSNKIKVSHISSDVFTIRAITSGDFKYKCVQEVEPGNYQSSISFGCFGNKFKCEDKRIIVKAVGKKEDYPEYFL